MIHTLGQAAKAPYILKPHLHPKAPSTTKSFIYSLKGLIYLKGSIYPPRALFLPKGPISSPKADPKSTPTLPPSLLFTFKITKQQQKKRKPI